MPRVCLDRSWTLDLYRQVIHVVISEHEVHALNLSSSHKGLAKAYVASFAHFDHLRDVHQGFRVAFVEHIQGMFSDVFSYASDYLRFSRLPHESSAHQGEGFL